MIDTKKDGEANGPQSGDIPPFLEVMLYENISTIFLGKFLAVSTAMDNKEPREDFDCKQYNPRLVFAHEVEKPLWIG